MEVKKIVEGMTAVEVAEVIDSNFKNQNKILEEDIAKQNNVIGVSEYKDFSEAEAVTVGDVRKYNGYLYECVEATTGAWDASKWKKSSFKAETEKKLSELSRLEESTKNGLLTISSDLYNTEKIVFDDVVTTDSQGQATTQTDLIAVHFEEGASYRIKANGPGNYSIVGYDIDKQRVGIIISDMLVGVETIVSVPFFAEYFVLWGNIGSDYHVEIIKIEPLACINKKKLDCIDSVEYKELELSNLTEIAGVLLSSGSFDYSVKNIKSVFVPINGGFVYKIEPKIIGLNTSAIFAFVKDTNLKNINYAGCEKGRIIVEETIEIKAPYDANYLLVVYRNNEDLIVCPNIYQSSKNCKLKESQKTVGEIEFVDYKLYDTALIFVPINSTSSDKRYNISKDLFAKIGSRIRYKVNAGIKVNAIGYDKYYNDLGYISEIWGENEGYLNVSCPYFRLIVSKTDGSVIKPEECHVEIESAYVPYRLEYPYFFIASEDSELTYREKADFIAPLSDARDCIQIASDIAYLYGTKLVMAPGTYNINSANQRDNSICLFFTQFVHETQYRNPYQGRIIEGLRKPTGYVGDATIIKITEDFYNSISDVTKIFATKGYSQDWSTYFMTSYLGLKNIIIDIPNNQKPIIAVDLSEMEGGSRLESLRIHCVLPGMIKSEEDVPKIPREGSVGVVSNPGATWNTNSYWNDIEIQGFEIGAKFMGMEHALVTNLTVQWCKYGMWFKGGQQHPITLIAIQDEHNINLPYFGDEGGAIKLMGYNAAWPEHAPGFFSENTQGWYNRMRATGNPRGTIEFNNNVNPNGSIASTVSYPTYFEAGHGKEVKVSNMFHKQAYNNSDLKYMDASNRFIKMAPNYMQRVYGLSENKELICVNPYSRKWVDVMGNVVYRDDKVDVSVNVTLQDGSGYSGNIQLKSVTDSEIYNETVTNGVLATSLYIDTYEVIAQGYSSVKLRLIDDVSKLGNINIVLTAK